MSLPVALGVDVGGTRLSVGVVSADGALVAARHEPTPRSAGAGATIPRIVAMLRESLAALEGAQVLGIGIGFGGPVDFAAQRIRHSHHAAGWGDADLAGVLAAEFSLPAVLDNDANAAALGEALFGAGRGSQTLLYVNIGTGVGGGVVLGGRVHHGANSNAGEFGHIVLDPAGPPCPCGKRGCVEALCSGDAIGRMARERVGQAPSLAPDLTGRKVGEMALGGCPEALAVIAESARWMGLALAGATNLLDPDVIVIGGGVAELGDIYLNPVREAFRAHVMPLPAEHTRILPAAMGYEAGVVGAAALILQQRSAEALAD